MGFCFAVSFYFSCNNKVSICNSVNYRYRVVVATTKVQIFKQITTGAGTLSAGCCCCCYHKGTNFQANHNDMPLSIMYDGLLLLPQRYKFSSKSQPTVKGLDSKNCCCCYHKGTNFQANHNLRSSANQPTALLLLPQRYKFSSKSQL